MQKFLIVGAGGREAAFASRLVQDVHLYAVMPHKNPLVADCVVRSGGQYLIGDSDDPQTILGFSQMHNIDFVFVSADQPLANGVVDVLLEGGFRVIGATKEAARIEWDKAYSINVMQNVCPEFTPFYRIVSDVSQLNSAIKEFESRHMQIVVKPQGLTGGKGVKVMPEHLESYEKCIDYATKLLESGVDKRVVLVQRLYGIEFTIMGITDGEHLVMSPASYDYPFRYEDDRGAGTGGMGCFIDSDKKLPFMTDQDMEDCRHIMQNVLDHMRDNGLVFSGVLNGGFFKTANGIKFMEFNARFGDPEVLCITSILESSFSKMLVDIWNKTLSERSVSFTKKACVVKYLVAKEYPEHSQEVTEFSMDTDGISAMDVDVFFASCIKASSAGRYTTLKKSRVVALGALAPSIEEASDSVNEAIRMYVTGDLEYRKDIGSAKSLAKIQQINQEISQVPV